MVNWESFYNAFRTPDFIAGYEIQHRLGGGAFGEVYKARKLSIGKAYAIKFLKVDEGADKDAIQRELEQVRLFASIDHPNLVTIEDMGLVSEVPYLIMGYAGEETLGRRLKQGRLARDEALRTFVQVCRGVLALHDRRLAHFDLKPGNVFLKGDVARVGDYGLAKLLVEGRSSLSFGRGTPHYMAPEMLKNRADHRADLYSLGVILFECLTGRVPFGAGASGVVVREDDSPPEFPPDFPSQLRPTVEACLRIAPEHRFDSVHELLEDMGQTARQGDSVRLHWSPSEPALPPASPPPTPPADDAAEEGDPATPVSGEELRRAASQLARGAVGVARGVWDGVRGRGGEGSAAESASTATPDGATQDPKGSKSATSAPTKPIPASTPPASEPADGAKGTSGEGGLGQGGEVLHVATLADGDDDGTPPAAIAFAAPEPGAVPRVIPRPTHAPDRDTPRTAEFAPAMAVAGEPAITVPVPPRETGGAIGALAATAGLGAEILGVLVTGPILTLLRGLREVLDRGLTRLPGALGAVARLVLLVLFFLTLGAVTALVFLGALMGGNLYPG